MLIKLILSSKKNEISAHVGDGQTEILYITCLLEKLYPLSIIVCSLIK